MSADHASLLRAHGLQVTAQRVAVLGAVADTAHASAHDIADDVRDRIGTISRQSVHDTLTVLADRGIVRRIQPAGSPARFEMRVGDNHHHLACRQCQRLVDVDCAVGDTPCLTPSDDWDFELDEAEVVYWGICPECRATPPSPSTSPDDPPADPTTNPPTPAFRTTQLEENP